MNGSFEGRDDWADFYFECRVLYKRQTEDDGARFEVALAFDGEVDETTLKTTATSLDRSVYFGCADIRGHFGTKVRTIAVYFSVLVFFLCYSIELLAVKNC